MIAAPLVVVSFVAGQIPEEQNESFERRATANLHQWGAITLFHGLPSDAVRAIAQDGDGVMWFGTDNGLARFDGRRTQTITDRALPSGRVLALMNDERNALWVGTETGAARRTENNFVSIAETTGRRITQIITPQPGRTLLASASGEIFDCRTQDDGSPVVQIITQDSLAGSTMSETRTASPVTSLAANDRGVFAGTEGRGLFAIEGERLREVAQRPRSYFIEAMERDAEGVIWLGVRAGAAGGGLFRASDVSRPVRVSAATGRVTAIKFDRRGRVWVGTNGAGVFYRSAAGDGAFERFTFAGTAGGLRSDYIYTIFVDAEGVVWFGTDKGVCRYDPSSPRVETISTNPEANFVRALFQSSDGRVWCGTNEGLFMSDGAADALAPGAWRAVADLSERAVYTIAEDGASRLLIGTADGLYISARSSNGGRSGDAPGARFVRVGGERAGASDESIRAIRVANGRVYIANFGRGVERLDATGRRTLLWPTDTNAPPREREVTSLHVEAANGRVWIGTARAGVFMMDGASVMPFGARGDVTPTDALNGLRGAAVWDIAGDPVRGRLWFATGRGLFAFHHGGALERFLPDREVRAVISARTNGEDNFDRMWVAGDGVTKISIHEEIGALTARLDREQGLPSQSVFALLPLRASGDGNDLLIGTNRGTARYTASDARPTLRFARVTSSRAHELSEIRSGLRLDYPQNGLVVDVAATSSRTFPEKFLYAFQLYDETGRRIEQRLARDSQFAVDDLAPGRYRIVARLFNNDLIEAEPQTFNFEIASAPFPVTTLALSVLLAVALIALLWGVWENRRLARTGSALVAANVELSGARMQLANEAEAERRRIARDLHDQTLADLRGLLMAADGRDAQISIVERDGAPQSSLDGRTLRAEIESVSNEIRRICEDLSPSVLENVGLGAALEWALAEGLAHLPPERKFEYEFHCAADFEEQAESLAPGVRIQIYRIAQEAISNVCRHSMARRVRLAVETTEENIVRLALEDDGRGFSARTKRAGRGLTNIRARAGLIGAMVAWTNAPDNFESGTRFILHIPRTHPQSNTEL